MKVYTRFFAFFAGILLAAPDTAHARLNAGAAKLEDAGVQQPAEPIVEQISLAMLAIQKLDQPQGEMSQEHQQKFIENVKDSFYQCTGYYRQTEVARQYLETTVNTLNGIEGDSEFCEEVNFSKAHFSGLLETGKSSFTLAEILKHFEDLRAGREEPDRTVEKIVDAMLAIQKFDQPRGEMSEEHQAIFREKVVDYFDGFTKEFKGKNFADVKVDKYILESMVTSLHGSRCDSNAFKEVNFSQIHFSDLLEKEKDKSEFTLAEILKHFEDLKADPVLSLTHKFTHLWETSRAACGEGQRPGNWRSFYAGTIDAVFTTDSAKTIDANYRAAVYAFLNVYFELFGWAGEGPASKDYGSDEARDKFVDRVDRLRSLSLVSDVEDPTGWLDLKWENLKTLHDRLPVKADTGEKRVDLSDVFEYLKASADEDIYSWDFYFARTNQINAVVQQMANVHRINFGLNRDEVKKFHEFARVLITGCFAKKSSLFDLDEAKMLMNPLKDDTNENSFDKMFATFRELTAALSGEKEGAEDKVLFHPYILKSLKKEGETEEEKEDRERAEQTKIENDWIRFAELLKPIYQAAVKPEETSLVKNSVKKIASITGVKTNSGSIYALNAREFGKFEEKCSVFVRDFFTIGGEYFDDLHKADMTFDEIFEASLQLIGTEAFDEETDYVTLEGQEWSCIKEFVRPLYDFSVQRLEGCKKSHAAAGSECHAADAECDAADAGASESKGGDEEDIQAEVGAVAAAGGDLVDDPRRGEKSIFG